MAELEDICDISNELWREAFNDPTVSSDLGNLRVDLFALFGPPKPDVNSKSVALSRVRFMVSPKVVSLLRKLGIIIKR